jgi:hypothetical protein
MAILGLVNSETYSAQRFTNYRRKVFYDYPNGAAPLTGILSMLEGEETNDPKFNWFEKRWKETSTTTASQGSSKGPLQTSAQADATDPATWTADTEYFVVVASNERFRIGHVVKIPVTTGSTTLTDLKGIVTSIAVSGKLKVRAINTVASIDNGTTNENVGREVLAIGSAFEEGGVDTTSQVYDLPLEFYNYTQIFRSPFSFTGTSLKTALKFDDSGPYKDKAKQTSIDHVVEIERSLMFGHRHSYVNSDGLPVRTYGGIIWHLQQWEAGTTYGVTASTLDTDDNKRIITNSGGTANEKTYLGYLERLFRKTNNRANEKLCLCGSGFLNVISQMYASKSVLNASLPMTETYGMDVVKHRCPFGIVYYKTHPLFNENSTLRYNALFLDVQFMRWRKFPGRDTDILKNRQPNDADYRKDEWFTEGGFEMQFPESNMYLQNVQDFTP